ncbi:MAG: DMT family transporter [Burkholderiales bacterium]|nr:DMT family transporter [Burkholderiales bacterium]
MNDAPPPRLALLGLLGVAIALGSGHVFARFAFTHGVSVLTAATVRSVAATVLLLGLLLVRRRGLWPLPAAARRVAFLGIAIAVQTVLVQVAVQRLPVALAILVFYTYPFLTSVASALIGESRFSLRLGAALATAFAGLVLVLGIGADRVDIGGVLAAFGAAASFTVALVLTPKLAPGLDPVLRTACTLGTATVLFIVAAATWGGFALPAPGPAAVGLAGLSICYAAGVVGLFLLLPAVGPIQAAFVLNLEPVAVAAVAWLWLGEMLSPLQIAGAGLVVVAVLGYQWLVRR